MNVTAIATALALRFGAAAITPPTGYDDIALSTHRLPNAIVTTPTVIVYPPEIESTFGGHKRSSNLLFPVRFFIAATSDMPRATDAILAWEEVLLDQLMGQFDLGQTANGVTHATIPSLSAGRGEYAEQEYAVVELVVLVHHESGYSPTSS